MNLAKELDIFNIHCANAERSQLEESFALNDIIKSIKSKKIVLNEYMLEVYIKTEASDDQFFKLFVKNMQELDWKNNNTILFEIIDHCLSGYFTSRFLKVELYVGSSISPMPSTCCLFHREFNIQDIQARILTCKIEDMPFH